MEDPTTSTGGDDGLSKTVFIAVIASVAGLIFIMAVIMIVAFIIVCYRDIRRRSQSQKHSDQVGLLRSKGEDEEVVSDQYEGDLEKIPVKDSQINGNVEVSLDAERKPSVLVALANGSKVTPVPSTAEPSKNAGEVGEAGGDVGASESQEKRKSRRRHSKGREEEGEAGVQKSKKKRKSKPVVPVGDGEEAEGDNVMTMIGGRSEEEEEEGSIATMGDKATYSLNAEVDDHGDKAQLVQTRKESPPKPKKVDMMTKSMLLGKPLSYVEELCKSAPLNNTAMAELVSATDASNPLIREYKSVPSNMAELPDLTSAEKAKNRYKNVLPNTHSAVHLKYLGTEGSSYINANYIRGLYGNENQFIASQGPTSDTIPDFWRMVWEQDVSIIVMLANIIENGRHKCAKYWPGAADADKVAYGSIEVTRVGEEKVPSCCTISHLTLKNLQTGEKREVYHFWYIAWPDFGIPRDAGPILRLRDTVNTHRAGSPTSGPIVVHCSAGLGRSGTFIGIDMGVQQYDDEKVVDPLKYLCEMRQDRGGMIQTPEQYLFVHKALAEYMK